eukprot:Protomagalhaensia_wolfi_Nauph_80__1768@NODE_20_length_4859_cov_275_667427_g15_i0_p2_GENE_NODE_20_length_4859_cov_275_667427_g15_i0NODE_20_length_4859_cov_275_667427_g15_i0_p2_ORF_typecomplete_len364_score80_41Cyclin_N/PF00134_23/1_6e12_NODE_20_length_4859_cov_275_667427_g15_i010122103
MGSISFPLKTTHLNHWIYRQREALQNEYQKNIQASTETFIQECRDKLTSQGLPFEADITPPFTVEDQQRMVRWFVRTGLQYCKEKLLSYRTIDTTMAFFTRFFLRESVARYQPSVLFFTCLIAAIKAENVGDPLTLEFLFKEAESQLSVAEVFRLEAVVLQVLKFHLLILHVGTPLTFLTNEYYLFKRRQNQLATPENWSPSNATHSNGSPKTPEELFGEFVGHLQEQCEQLSLRTYESQLNFLYSPAELAVGIFLHVASVDFGLDATTLLEFVTGIQPAAIQTVPAEVQKFKERALILKHEIFSFAESAEVDFDAARFAAKFKEIRKWRLNLERGGRKKRDTTTTSGGTEPQSKKPKLEDDT